MCLRGLKGRFHLVLYIVTFRTSFIIGYNSVSRTDLLFSPDNMDNGQTFTLTVFIVLIQSPRTALVKVTAPQPTVEALENESVLLQCFYETQRENNPHIEWKKRGEASPSLIYYDKQFMGNFKERAEINGASVTLHKITQKDAGVYYCEVRAPRDDTNLEEATITLKVLVPPNTPSCTVPSNALTGSVVVLQCTGTQSIPPATYRWYKDNKELKSPSASNSTFTVNGHTGVLHFNVISRSDSGQYHCEASNGVGTPKRCAAKHMKIDDLNVPAIVAAVVLGLLIALCCLGVCYAHRHGYFTQARRGRSFWIPQCHGVAHISSQDLHRPDEISNTGHSHTHKDDYKHTQSFLL